MLTPKWLEQLTDLYFLDDEVGPRGLKTTEVLDWKLRLTPDDQAGGTLLDVPERKLNYRFAVAEWLWMTFGHSDVATIDRYNPKMRHFSDEGIWLQGAYGPHLNLNGVLGKLRQDPDTRQAVSQIPRPQVKTRDEPCTLSLQWLNREGALHCIVTMRSSDIWLGVPYDVFSFTQLQNMLAGELKLKRGIFVLNAGSSHLYHTDRKAVSALIDVYRESLTPNALEMPALPGLPPTWLDQILIDPAKAELPKFQAMINSSDDWGPYARVLCATSQAEARQILVGLSHVA